MKIGLITYNAPHRKTQDILIRLASNKDLEISLFAMPFVARKKRQPIYPHRPSWAAQLFPEDLAQLYSIKLFCVEADDLLANFKQENIDYGVIGGAGLLPDDFVLNFDLLNCHPGLLPKNRGLDAFKWAIHNSEPIGVSLHLIDNTIDAGWLIAQKKCPIYSNDTYHSFAFRQYELEIDLLCETVNNLPLKKNLQQLSTKVSEATRRMPSNLEINLLEKFEEYKMKFLVE